MIDLKDSHLLGEPNQNPSADPQAWKRMIGDQPIEARLETLPDKRIRRGALAVSSIVQVTVAAALVMAPLLYPEHLSIRAIYQVTPVAAPVIEVNTDPPKAELPRRASPLPIQPPEPLRAAKLFAPQPLVAPKPKVIEPRNSEVPKLEPVLARTTLQTSVAEPERPREPVKTGVLNTESAAQPTLKVAAEKVQTGGFGDPNGFASHAADAKRGNVARLGSFELPSGPGYGNGTGGVTGARGVTSAGFGNGVAATATSARPGTVQSSGFGAVQIAPAAKSAPRQAEAPLAIQPVVILSKPNPVYTDEARRLGIEGDVLVEVIFRASGQVQTVRVLKGLGHGLDEAALRAAEQIRFKPAMQEGRAVDFSAIAHIVFQLAY